MGNEKGMNEGPSSVNQDVDARLDTQTILMSWIAAMMVTGAAWLLAPILVPFVLALTLAIAISPMTRRLESMGLARTLTSLICLLLITCVLVFTSGLLIYQAGTILQDSDKYLDRMSQLLTDATDAVGGEHFLETIRTIDPQGEPSEPTLGGGAAGAGVGMGQSESQPGNETKESPKAYWDRFLRSNLSVLGGWLISGIGGLVGAVGAAVICLSFLFYLLETRTEWIERLIKILGSLGFRPRRDCLPRIQHAITTFTGFVAMISVIGATVIGTTAWLLGLPQPFLWGLIFGLLEFVPYFGPMIGGSLLVLVALATGSGGWWPPILMLGVILIWMTLEGYVISPMIYGRAVEFDPVMVLVAILFFGWLWGPLGMITALPMMVILRELVVMRPDTPALDALMEPEDGSKSSPAKTA